MFLFQKGRRKVADATYYESQLRSRISEISAEIQKMQTQMQRWFVNI